MAERTIKAKAWHTKSKRMIDLERITPMAINPEVPIGQGIYIPYLEDLILLEYLGEGKDGQKNS